MKICPNCNFENESEAQFCVECWTNIKNISEKKADLWNSFEIKFWKTSKITCDENFVSWNFLWTKFLFFKIKEEIYLPISEISSIKYLVWPNVTILKIIFAFLFLFWWIFLLVQWKGTSIAWLIVLIFAWFIIYSIFKKVSKITIKTSTDKIIRTSLEFSKNPKLKQFTEFVTQKIIENKK